jgi:hypothetical protein
LKLSCHLLLSQVSAVTTTSTLRATPPRPCLTRPAHVSAGRRAQLVRHDDGRFRYHF